MDHTSSLENEMGTDESEVGEVELSLVGSLVGVMVLQK